MDLFGQEITAPAMSATTLARAKENAAMGFNEFWLCWPSGPRKVSKQSCLDRWARYDCAENWKHIVAHVEYLKTTPDWQAGRIPMPATYLNQRRWDDWTPEPERPKQPDVLQQIKAHKGAPIPEEIRRKMQELIGR